MKKSPGYNFILFFINGNIGFQYSKKNICTAGEFNGSDMADRPTDDSRRPVWARQCFSQTLDKHKLSGGDLTSHPCPRYVAPRVDTYVMHK